MTITFYTTNVTLASHGFVETLKEIEETYHNIYTTQMCLLCTDLLHKFDTIYVVEPNRKLEFTKNKDGRSIDIVDQYGKSVTDKEVRFEHNIYKMWRAGTLG